MGNTSHRNNKSVTTGTLEGTTMLCRCLVLNQSYEYLEITSWYKAICHLIEGKATALAEYDDVVHSQYCEWKVPSVIVCKEYKVTKKRHSTFGVANKRNLLVRDGWKCCYCGAKLSLRSGTVEHIVPQSKGGKNTLENTAIACKACNNIKGDLSLSAFTTQFGMKLNVVPRQLTDEEKISCILKTVKSKERNAWLAAMKEYGISLY